MPQIHEIEDIFKLWPTVTQMAIAIAAKPDTVRKWKKFKRIPQDAWRSVIDAALIKGAELTVDDIMAVNQPMKQRGQPAHKPKSRKRCESRVSG
jgi:hypothetical protein